MGVHVYGYEFSFVYMSVNTETQVSMGHCSKSLSTLLIDRRSLLEPRALDSAHLSSQLAPRIPCLSLPNLGTTGFLPQMPSLVDGCWKSEPQFSLL